MKRVLLVGNIPTEVREILVANKDLFLIHDSNEFKTNQIFFDVLADYDAVVLTESSDFAFHILEEMATQNKAVLFRDAYCEPNQKNKIKNLEEKANAKKLFFKRLSLFDGAPVYEKILSLFQTPLSKIEFSRSFPKNLSEEALLSSIDEHLFIIDKIAQRKGKRSDFIFRDERENISRVEGKIDTVDYVFNLSYSDVSNEEITLYSTGCEYLEAKNGNISYIPPQGAIQKFSEDMSYLPVVKPLLDEFVQSIGKL